MCQKVILAELPYLLLSLPLTFFSKLTEELEFYLGTYMVVTL